MVNLVGLFVPGWEASPYNVRTNCGPHTAINANHTYTPTLSHCRRTHMHATHEYVQVYHLLITFI